MPFFGTTIANGQSTIVRYIHSYKYCDEHTDQSYETLMFEIPPNTTTFSIADSISLRQAKAIFSFWPTGSEEAYFLTQGSIEGKKLSDGSWQVKASLFSPKGGNRIAFNNRFQPVN